jgi:hypothetical protein
MPQDEQREAIDATSSLMETQVGHEPPNPVLAAVLAVTGYTTPIHVATIAECGEAGTTWHVLGCTERILFQVTGHKAVSDWSAGREGDPDGDASVTARVVPLSRLTGMVLELSDGSPGSGDPGLRLCGTRQISCEPGDELALPTDADNPDTREALKGIARTVLAAMI